MSMEALTAALYLTHTPSGEPLKLSAKITAHMLAACTPADSNICWPSIKTLQELTILSSRTLHDALKTLEDCGYITRTPRVGQSNTFTLNVEAMKATHRRLHHSSGSTETPVAQPAPVEAPVAPQALAPVKVEPVEVAPIEVEIISNPVEAVETPQGPANAPEGMITHPVQENPAEAPSEPVQGELIPAPTKPKAKKPRKRAAEIPGLEEDFIEFYTTYPLKKDRGTARGTYEKIRRRGVPAEEILEGAKRFAEATAAKLALDPSAKRFIKHPSTWLNAEAWLNSYEDEAPVQELTPTQRKVRRLAQSLQAMQDAQGLPQGTGVYQAPALSSSTQAPAQATRELTYNPAGGLAPMGAQDTAPTDSMWSSARWTRTKTGIPQLVV